MQLSVKPEQITYPLGISISVDGFKGDIGHDVPSQVFIEIHEGRLRVHVWNGDEDPVATTEIDRV